MPYSPHTPSRPPSRSSSSTSPSSQWYFTKSEMSSTPSIREGMSVKDEMTNRTKGVNLIDQVGQKLRLHQVTIATAAMFFHRFYMRCPLQRFHHYEVAATCIFLASKVEENPRKLPDLIRETVRHTQHNQRLEVDEQSKEYWKWRDSILYMEEQLLESLCFDFDITHPYDYVVQLVQRFAPGNSALGRCAWAFINDSHRTVMQVMYTPHVIAAAAFYFARKFTHAEIPKRPDGREWWEEYGVKIEQLRGAVMMMVDVYNTLPHLKYHGQYPASVVSPQEQQKENSHQNGTTAEEDVEMKDAASTPADSATQMVTEDQEKVTLPALISPKLAPSQPELPKSSKGRSPTTSARGRSPGRPSRGRDTYRPGDRSRSRSVGRGKPPRGVDRYVPPIQRRGTDTYIPSRSPRKRPNDENSPSQGREKRRRTPDEDISEGEIR